MFLNIFFIRKPPAAANLHVRPKNIQVTSFSLSILISVNWCKYKVVVFHLMDLQKEIKKDYLLYIRPSFFIQNNTVFVLAKTTSSINKL